MTSFEQIQTELKEAQKIKDSREIPASDWISLQRKIETIEIRSVQEELELFFIRLAPWSACAAIICFGIYQNAIVSFETEVYSSLVNNPGLLKLFTEVG